MPTESVEQRKLAVIMFTDMVGYSALTQKDEALALKLLEEHRQLLRPLFRQHSGTEIKTIGDAFLVDFNCALDAVHWRQSTFRKLADQRHLLAQVLKYWFMVSGWGFAGRLFASERAKRILYFASCSQARWIRRLCSRARARVGFATLGVANPNGSKCVYLPRVASRHRDRAAPKTAPSHDVNFQAPAATLRASPGP